MRRTPSVLRERHLAEGFQPRGQIRTALASEAVRAEGQNQGRQKALNIHLRGLRVNRKLGELGWFLTLEMWVPYRVGWSDAGMLKPGSPAWTWHCRCVEEAAVGVGSDIEARYISETLAVWVRPKSVIHIEV